MIPDGLYAYDAVQIVLLLLLGAAVLWLCLRSITHGERLAKLETIVTNHYAHRFEQLSRHTGVEYKDED